MVAVKRGCVSSCKDEVGTVSDGTADVVDVLYVNM
jgi:hypothetical protein